MVWNNDPRGIFCTLPMQAALHLYLPHLEEPYAPPHREAGAQCPSDRRPRPAASKRKRIQDFR